MPFNHLKIKQQSRKVSENETTEQNIKIFTKKIFVLSRKMIIGSLNINHHFDDSVTTRPSDNQNTYIIQICRSAMKKTRKLQRQILQRSVFENYMSYLIM